MPTRRVPRGQDDRRAAGRRWRDLDQRRAVRQTAEDVAPRRQGPELLKTQTSDEIRDADGDRRPRHAGAPVDAPRVSRAAGTTALTRSCARSRRAQGAGRVTRNPCAARADPGIQRLAAAWRRTSWSTRRTVRRCTRPTARSPNPPPKDFTGANAAGPVRCGARRAAAQGSLRPAPGREGRASRPRWRRWRRRPDGWLDLPDRRRLREASGRGRRRTSPAGRTPGCCAARRCSWRPRAARCPRGSRGSRTIAARTSWSRR